MWLGVSAGTQQYADERLPVLLQTPAVIRWVSVEPMLGPVDLTEYLHGLHWVVKGGESGPNARPFKTEWALDLVDQFQQGGWRAS